MRCLKLVRLRKKRCNGGVGCDRFWNGERNAKLA